MNAPEPAPPKRRPCPICSRPADAAFRPFCSKRCADIDLNRWLKGSYAIPATEDQEGPSDQDAPERQP